METATSLGIQRPAPLRIRPPLIPGHWAKPADRAADVAVTMRHLDAGVHDSDACSSSARASGHWDEATPMSISTLSAGETCRLSSSMAFEDVFSQYYGGALPATLRASCAEWDDDDSALAMLEHDLSGHRASCAAGCAGACGGSYAANLTPPPTGAGFLIVPDDMLEMNQHAETVQGSLCVAQQSPALGALSPCSARVIEDYFSLPPAQACVSIPAAEQLERSRSSRRVLGWLTSRITKLTTASRRASDPTYGAGGASAAFADAPSRMAASASLDGRHNLHVPAYPRRPHAASHAASAVTGAACVGAQTPPPCGSSTPFPDRVQTPTTPSRPLAVPSPSTNGSPLRSRCISAQRFDVGFFDTKGHAFQARCLNCGITLTGANAANDFCSRDCKASACIQHGRMLK